MSKDTIYRQAAIEDVKSWVAVDGREKHLKKDVIEWLKEFPSAQPEPQCIPVTKEQILQAGYEGREVRFHIGGRLFAIRELAQ